MRKLFMFLFCFTLCSILQAQTTPTSGPVGDSTILFNLGKFGIRYVDSVGNGVTFWQDSTVEIFGDTMAIIKLLNKYLNEGFEREEKLWKVISTSIDFSNSVSDYFKTSKNKAWTKYYAELKKQGYYLKNANKKK